MTSTPDTADRRVAGLSRRRADPDPARLIAANRPAPLATAADQPVQDDAVVDVDPTPAPAADQLLERTPAPVYSSPGRRRPRPTAQPVQPPASETDHEVDAPRKVTTYMRPSVRDRAAVAFKATAYFEQDDSWSHMVEKAVLAEVERREAAHNGGRPFAADGAMLKRGRLIR
ncbi:ParB family protein [Nakamurella endophytica]|uniref:Centromere-binding protein ParB C-terminal domain-containing protein n=1 Tax=Nakamurella endophytica TaxID=1748367 RepID=A0A917WMZ8_9ACTN|nr:hypothetical protein [Nakamurella endophytica]GGM16221.1 hypothetical protein GCM10011594_40300 [Nakamurella endophytica]